MILTKLRGVSEVSRLFGLLVFVVLITACGGSSVSNCGVPYRFSLPDGSHVLSGDCAGLLLRRTPSVTMRTGEIFSVQIGHEQSGALDFPVPRPSTRAVEVLSRENTTVQYRAARAGRALLGVAGSKYCLDMGRKGDGCAALAVRVLG